MFKKKDLLSGDLVVYRNRVERYYKSDGRLYDINADPQNLIDNYDADLLCPSNPDTDIMKVYRGECASHFIFLNSEKIFDRTQEVFRNESVEKAVTKLSVEEMMEQMM